MVDTWEGQLQPLTDPSSLTIYQFVMVLLIVLIEHMNNVCDVMGFSGKSWGRPNFEKSGVDPPRFHSMTDWEIGSIAFSGGVFF